MVCTENMFQLELYREQVWTPGMMISQRVTIIGAGSGGAGGAAAPPIQKVGGQKRVFAPPKKPPPPQKKKREEGERKNAIYKLNLFILAFKN